MRAFKRVMCSICFGAIGIGILLVILGASLGGTRWNNNYRGIKGADEAMNSEYKEVARLNFDLDFGELVLKTGTSFSVDAQNINEELFRSEVSEQGEWKMTYKVRTPFYDWANRAPVFTVTIPEDSVLDSLKLKMGAGRAEIWDVRCENADLVVGAGKMEVKRLEAGGETRLEVGAGEIIADVATDRVVIDCGVGNIDLDGEARSGGKVKCGVGKVDLNLNGDAGDYNFDISNGIGKVTVNGNSYRGNTHMKSGNGLEKAFKLDCGVGRIEMNIR